MAVSSAPYFYPAPLRQRFTRDVVDAFIGERISIEEKLWLDALGAPPLLQSPLVGPPRLDLLITDDGAPTTAEMTSALLLSHPSSKDPRVYLSTLLYGLERFDNRAQLQARLNDLFALRAQDRPAFEYQAVEDALFSQRMMNIIDQQAAHVQAVAHHLEQLPDLRAALRHVLQQRLAAKFPAVQPEASAVRVQILQNGQGAGSSVVRLQSLLDALTELFTGIPLPAGQTRSYLNHDGTPSSAADALLYEAALTDSVQHLKPGYETLIADFWLHRKVDGLTGRERIAAALAENLRQQLLARRHDGFLAEAEFHRLAALLRPAKESAGKGYRTEVRRLCVASSDQQALKLVGLVLIDFRLIELPDLVLYSPEGGLRRFATMKAISDHFSSDVGRGEIRHYLSFNDLSLLPATGPLSLTGYELEHSLLDERVDSLIAMQQRNLDFALSAQRGSAQNAAAMIDDALDLRRLIDPRLMHFDGGGRWLKGEPGLTQRWPFILRNDPVSTPATPAMANEGQKLESGAQAGWLEQLEILEHQVEVLHDARPDLHAYASSLLDQSLAVLCESPPPAAQIFLQWPDNIGRSGLVEVFLEQLSGCRVAKLPEHCVAVTVSTSVQVTALAWLTTELLNHVLQRLHATFLEGYIRQIQQSCSGIWRSADTRFDLGTLFTDMHWHLLRLDLDLEGRLEGIKPVALAMLQQVLNHPDAVSRQQFGEGMTQVCSVSLVHDSARPAATMSQAFVLRQPRLPANGVLLWSAMNGLMEADSLEMLQLQVNLQLVRARSRDRWLDGFAEQDQAQLRDYLQRPTKPLLALDMRPVDGDFLHAMLQSHCQRQTEGFRQTWQDATRGQMSARLLVRFVDQGLTSRQRLPALRLLGTAVQVSVTTARLPAWLKNVDNARLFRFVQMFRRFRQSTEASPNFLDGIPALKTFSRDTLLRQLNIDFPGRALDPDTLGIKITRYVPSPVALGDMPSSIAAATIINRESLTDFALNHFSDIQGATVGVELPVQMSDAPTLTAEYVQALIRKLDVGAQYQAMIGEKLDDQSPDYPVRRMRFFKQVSAGMLLYAQEMTLQNRLSQTAYDYLETLLDMPDSVARQTVHGQRIVLRPLQLLPAAGMAPDTAMGIYLIGPQDASQGPVILHTLFNLAYGLKEYADSAAFLRDLCESGELQTLVLDRLPESLRSRYDNGGFSEAHIPWSTEGFLDFPLGQPAPVQLVGTPQVGNVLHFLFDETVKVIKAISKKQSVTTAQADWQSFVHLMSLGSEQALFFVPGRLGVLLAAWQSRSSFNASASAAYDQQWGKAVAELSAALGTLVSSRETLKEARAESETLVEEVPVPSAQAEFSWRNSQLTPELKARLRAYEARDAVLQDMRKDELYNLYLPAQGDEHYAAVAGRVYRVQQVNDRWFIVGEQGNGPRIRLNQDQQWELDLDWGLRGGGGLVTRFRAATSELEVDRVMTVEARGIRQIRRRFHERAAMITQGRQQAIDYLRNCLFNLTLTSSEAGLDVRVQQQIEAFFGVQNPDAALIEAIRKTASDLYVAITDPSLSGFSSKRYVVGANKEGYEGTVAFVIKNDPLQRIYFTERYFQTPAFRLKPWTAGHGGFDMDGHYRAASLLHELSHLVNDSHDIAYLEAGAPFRDLLGDPVSPDDTFREDLERLQTRSLSHRTDPLDLFVRFDRSLWRDLNDWDGEGKQAVLRITGQPTLELARGVFLSDAQKRSQIILANADSVALLVMQLGRQRFSLSHP